MIATRVYQFASRNAQFHVEISCKPQSGKMDMTLQSFVGDVESPTEQSAFTALHLENGSMPVARVKFKDGNVFSTPLYTYFALGEYANKAVFIASPALGEALPMLLEIGNGAGTFELTINRPSEVEQVLAACGQDQKSLIEQQREQAKGIVLAELKRSCKYFGHAAAYDAGVVEKRLAELTIHPDVISEMEMDCEKSAPEELSIFAKEMKGSYETHRDQAHYQAQNDANDFREYARIPMQHLCTFEEYIAYSRTLGNGYADAEPNSPACEKWKLSLNPEVPDDGRTGDSSESSGQSPSQDEILRAATDASDPGGK